jgi:phosphohistidine swiveling domain-containing protein
VTALWLDEIGDADLSRVGAKAFVLARLRRAGLPVPDGFVLVTGTDLEGAGRAALAAAYARLGGSVAVRSSSTAEDLAGASFAGQYSTVLDVRGGDAVMSAVRVCLDSARSGEGYARAVGTEAAGAMAVLVERFVEPRTAGVAFTRHPQKADAILVESHAGRGEALVSGQVTPDAYVLDRETGALRSGPADGSLGVDDLAVVAHLARAAEALLGAPQDVEWAIGHDGAVLLQSRPITVEAEERADPSARRLTRANVGEVMPDPVTPLTWTTVCAFLEHGFHEVARQAGLLPPRAGSFLLLYRRRLYLNLTLSLDTGMRIPGIEAADAERLILGGGSMSAEPPALRASAVPFLAAVGLRLAALAWRLPTAIGDVEARVDRLPSRETIDASDEAQLARLWRTFEETGRIVGSVHIATSGSSAVRLALLGRLVERWGLGEPADLVNRLVAGLPGVASAAPALALESLAAEARRRPEWEAWLRERSPVAAADALGRGEAPSDLIPRLRGFLREFGHRAVSEGELAAPSWQDDPAPLFAALTPLLDSPRSAAFGHRSRAEARRADEDAALYRLGPLRRVLFDRVLEGAQDWVRERERTKSAAVALVEHARRLARASGRRLAASGALRRNADVLFLNLSELMAALEGTRPSASLIERRRRRHEREGALPAPREVDLLAEDADAPRDVADAGPLHGIGVSAGMGAGPARVLRPGDPPTIAPGEVLVASVLDAALGPLLASAAGAVAEIGGMLSHGSVVARELGVPCVVDVRDATRRIVPGSRLLVDGASGRITVLSDEIGGPAGEAERSHFIDAAPDDGVLHAAGDHPLARESVYFNAQDPRSGLRLITTLGLRPGCRAEALAALALPGGRLLFGLDREAIKVDPTGFEVGEFRARWNPTRLRFEGYLASHEAVCFPPGPLPLLLMPRTVAVTIDLTFTPSTPSIDLCASLTEEQRGHVEPLGHHHVEQAGRWRGAVRVDGLSFAFDGDGGRDHSWGNRDWSALDHSRLFTVRFGDDLALHALALSVGGRRVEGGFLWRDGRAEAIRRVEWAPDRRGAAMTSFELEVTTARAERLQLHGVVERNVPVPVALERRPWRLACDRPYGLLLHEGFARYELARRTGVGMVEVSERPR